MKLLRRKCIVCGDEYQPIRGHSLTCSPPCSKQAKLERERKRWRAKRGTDPAKYIENRDPDAVLARRRERYRRGQAARRARVKAQQ
jgi:hypothetical protein